LTGVFYRSLWDHSYFANAAKPPMETTRTLSNGVSQ
jgi:hypothetical protein